MKLSDLNFFLSLLAFPLLFVVASLAIPFVDVYILENFEPKFGKGGSFRLACILLVICSFFGILGYGAVVGHFWAKVRLLSARKLLLVGVSAGTISYAGGFLFGEWLIFGFGLLAGITTASFLHLATKNQAPLSDVLSIKLR